MSEPDVVTPCNQEPKWAKPDEPVGLRYLGSFIYDHEQWDVWYAPYYTLERHLYYKVFVHGSNHILWRHDFYTDCVEELNEPCQLAHMMFQLLKDT